MIPSLSSILRDDRKLMMPNTDTDTNTTNPIKKKWQLTFPSINTPSKSPDNVLSTIHFFLKTNFMLALGKVILVIPTQPLHVVMRRQQGALASNPPRVLSFGEAYSEIRMNQPMKALFKGTLPGSVKEFSKNLFYKGALITGAPHLAESLLPQSIKEYTSTTQYHLIKCVFAGSIASFSDALLGGGLERIATYRATSQGKEADASFSKEFLQNQTVLGKIRFLYKGFVPTALKGTLAFSTMFAVSQPIRYHTAAMYGHSPKDAAPWYSSLTSAFLAGLAVAFVSSPLDIIKTQAQMPGSKGKNTFRALHDNYSLHGLRGITAGLPAKTAMITMGWSLNFFAMQKMDEYKEKRNQTETTSVHLNRE